MVTAYKILTLLMIIPLGIFTCYLILSLIWKSNREYAKWKMISSIVLTILFVAYTIIEIMLGVEFFLQAAMIVVWTINAFIAWGEYKELKFKSIVKGDEFL